jgi:glycosyltransferase involved in cell wall biosynthesis
MRRAAAIVSTSRWAADDVQRLYPAVDTPIHVLSPPVRLDMFGREWAAERRARPDARPQCLFVGGDFPRKGGYDLLKAWESGGFARRADLILVTDWPFDVPLPDGVRCLTRIEAYTPAWTALWRAADLFVMPTRNEAFGLVFQEAAAAGLPAIGTRLNAIPEIVSDGETGILVTPASIPELAAALDRLISSAELRAAFGLAARHKIEEDADPERHRRFLVELIKNLAG